MSRKRQEVPDWPKSLALEESGPAPTLEQVSAALPKTAASMAGVALPTQHAPLTAFFFGLTKDRRHLAAEVQVEGTKVVGVVPLCASQYPEQASNVWESAAFYRLCHQRPYTAVEAAANARQGGKVGLEDILEGQAVALAQKSGKTVALAMEVEGTKVTEPKVLGTGNRLFAWQEAHAYAQRWFLPRRRK